MPKLTNSRKRKPLFELPDCEFSIGANFWDGKKWNGATVTFFNRDADGELTDSYHLKLSRSEMERINKIFNRFLNAEIDQFGMPKL